MLVTGYCSGVQIKKNQMSGACRMYEWQEQGTQDFCAESAGKRQIGRHIGRWGRIVSNVYSRNRIKGAWTTLI